LLLSEDKTHLFSLVGNDKGETDRFNRVNIPINNSVAGLCVLEKRSLRVDDAYKHPKFYGEVDRQTGFKTRDLLCAPIVNSENEIIGVIQVVNSLREGGFAHRDLTLLNAFSAHIGITIASVTASDDDHRVEMKEALRLIKNQKKYLEEVEKLL
jgi:adenylate cyclase